MISKMQIIMISYIKTISKQQQNSEIQLSFELNHFEIKNLTIEVIQRAFNEYYHNALSLKYPFLPPPFPESFQHPNRAMFRCLSKFFQWSTPDLKILYIVKLQHTPILKNTVITGLCKFRFLDKYDSPFYKHITGHIWPYTSVQNSAQLSTL